MLREWRIRAVVSAAAVCGACVLFSCTKETPTEPPDTPPEPWGYWEPMYLPFTPFNVQALKRDLAGGTWALAVENVDYSSEWRILRYEDGAWRVEVGTDPLPMAVNNFFPAGADDIWVVTMFKEIFVWRGAAWEKVYEAPGELWDICMVSADEGWAVGEDGIVVHYKDDVFSEERLPDGATAYELVFNGPSDGWAVGSSGVLYHWDGASWDSIYPPFDAHGVQPLGGGACRAAGDRNYYAAVGRYDGGTWRHELLPGTKAAGDVYFPGEDEGWLFCTAPRSLTRGGAKVAKVLHSRDGRWRVDELPFECAGLHHPARAADGALMCGGRKWEGGGVILRYGVYNDARTRRKGASAVAR
jgi:hypothetical protein